MFQPKAPLSNRSPFQAISWGRPWLALVVLLVAVAGALLVAGPVLAADPVSNSGGTVSLPIGEARTVYFEIGDNGTDPDFCAAGRNIGTYVSVAGSSASINGSTGSQPFIYNSPTCDNAGVARVSFNIVGISAGNTVLNLFQINALNFGYNANFYAGAAATITIVVADPGPSLTVPADTTVEATSAAGATVPFAVSATDVVDGNVPVTCRVGGNVITSPADFPLNAATTVECRATDSDGFVATKSFTVTVEDTTAPVFTDVPGPLTVPATSSAGAVVTFPLPVADDAVDGIRPVTCTPPSGSVFPIGSPTTVECTATDASGRPGTVTFTVTVTDTTGPVIDAGSIPGTPTEVNGETINVLSVTATGPLTTVSWPELTADDAISGPLTATCTPASGTGFAVADTEVSCTATDALGNVSSVRFIVRVTAAADTAPPVFTDVPGPLSVPATGTTGSVVTFTPPIATDDIDGIRPVTCEPASGTTFPIGTTPVRCSAIDAAGNTGAVTFTVTVNALVPVVTRATIRWVGGPQPGQSYTAATVPAAPTCEGIGFASPVTQCRVYSYSAAPGRWTMTARARDVAGNSAISTRSYTVTAGLAPTATATPRPTGTPRPTTTVRPTSAPRPTATPRPTSPPVVEPTVTPGVPVVEPTATPVPPVIEPTPTRPSRPTATPRPRR